MLCISFEENYLNYFGGILMKKKLLFAMVLLIICIGVVSANQTVTVGDYKFNIPDNYEHVRASDIDNQNATINFQDCHVDSKTFANYFQEISITVTTLDDGEFPDAMKSFYGGGHDTNIKGIDGYIFLDGNDYGFSYVRDGKWVVIKSWDLYNIEDIVIA